MTPEKYLKKRIKSIDGTIEGTVINIGKRPNTVVVYGNFGWKKNKVVNIKDIFIIEE
jgi:hypothetical protein